MQTRRFRLRQARERSPGLQHSELRNATVRSLFVTFFTHDLNLLFRWMAPEVKRGQYNLPADVYSLGLVLFEIFEKKLPVFDQIRQTVVLPSSFQSASVVMPCLHPNPERRPTSEQAHSLCPIFFSTNFIPFSAGERIACVCLYPNNWFVRWCKYSTRCSTTLSFLYRNSFQKTSKKS